MVMLIQHRWMYNFYYRNIVQGGRGPDYQLCVHDQGKPFLKGEFGLALVILGERWYLPSSFYRKSCKIATPARPWLSLKGTALIVNHRGEVDLCDSLKYRRKREHRNCQLECGTPGSTRLSIATCKWTETCPAHYRILWIQMSAYK